MNFRKSVLFALSLIYTQFAFGQTLETNLVLKNALTTKVTGTGNITRYEFVGTNELHLISQYNSSSTDIKTVICKLKNIDLINPLLANQIQSLLLTLTTTPYVTISCMQKIAESTVVLPADIKTLEIVVDLGKNPDLFKIKFDPATVLINSGYSSIVSKIIE